MQRKFMAACKANKIDVARELLLDGKNQININDTGNDERTPLHFAVVNGSYAFVKLLVENGCNVDLNSLSVIKVDSAPNLFFRFYEPPLVTATRINHTTIADYLIGQGCLVNKRGILLDEKTSGDDGSEESKPGTTALHYASLYCNVVIATRLIEHGANPNEVDYDCNLPLHLAVACRSSVQTCRRQAEIVSLLCKHGSDPSLKNRRACSSLLLSVMYGCFPSVEILLGSPAIEGKMDSFAVNGRTSPLHFSAQKSRHDISTALIRAGHKLDSKDHKGLTPILVNVYSHSISPVALILIYHGCEVNCRDKPSCYSSLMTTAMKNPRLDCESLAYALVKVGYDLNQDMWLIPSDGLQTEVGRISRGKFFDSYRLKSSPPAESFSIPKGRMRKLKTWLQEELRKPKNLSDICRIVVRRKLYAAVGGISIEDGIRKLGLPHKLESFISLRDFIEQSDDGTLKVLL